MKRILIITLLVVTATCGTGCTTGYWLDRGRDAADVFTIGVGVGAGAQARLGIFSTGLGFHGSFLGLETGQFFAEVEDMEGGDFSILVFGLHESRHDKLVVDRYKDYKQEHWFGVAKLYDNHGSAGVSFHSNARRNPSYYTQIDASVGLFGSFKIGFNPGELIDFLLGFVGVDIYGDDLERQKKHEIEQKNSG